VQQTAVAVAETKDQTVVDVDSETILVSGSSYFFYAVAETAGVLTAVDAAMTACGSSSYCSAVAALAETTEIAADADATTVATRNKL